MRKIFKKIVVKKVRTTEGRKKVYVNLASAERFGQSSKDCISWEALLAYEPKFDFNRGRQTEEYLERVARDFQSKHVFGGQNAYLKSLIQ